MRLNLAWLIARTDMLRYWRRGGKTLVWIAVIMAILSLAFCIYSALDTRTHLSAETAAAEAKAAGRAIPGRLVLTGADSAVVRSLATCTVTREADARREPSPGEVFVRLPAGFDASLSGATTPKVVCRRMRDDEVAREVMRELAQHLARERLTRVTGDPVRGAALEQAARHPIDYTWDNAKGGESESWRAMMMMPCLLALMTLMSATNAIIVRERFGNGMRHLLLTGVTGAEILTGKLVALTLVAILGFLGSFGGFAIGLGFLGALALMSATFSPWAILGAGLLLALGLANLILLMVTLTFSAKDGDAAASRLALLFTGLMIPVMLLVSATDPLWSYVLLPVPLISGCYTGLDWATNRIPDPAMAAALAVQGAWMAALLAVCRRVIAHEARASGAASPFRAKR